MRAQQLVQFFHKPPRKAFRLNLKDGSHVDVRHPDLADLYWWKVAVNIPEKNSTIIEKRHVIGLDEITGAEYIASRANGKRKNIHAK
ncbi:MAG TPA: hypothetical protein VKX17_01525 [Planctomycetota bacterium]|nr:hypothetical protein [Planctomycetota bacterium]